MHDTTTSDDRRIDTDHIPNALKRRDQWVCWRYEGDHKPSYNPITNRREDPTDPDTWTDFDTALDAYQNENYDGIGFALTEDDPFAGLDFDDCRDPTTDDIHEDVAEVLDQIDSYSEISPSGTGTHTIVRGEKPDEYGCRGDRVEVYDSGQYLTVTGEHVEETPLRIEDRPDELTRLCEVRLTEQSTAGDPIEAEELEDCGAGGSDEAGDLPEYDEGLADVGEEVLRTLQREDTPAFNLLCNLLGGETGSYDDLILEDGKIDRSLQELMALTRLHQAVVYLGKEEGNRAEAITRSTFERYVSNHRTTDDGQVRKWLTRGDPYRKDRLQRAIEGCDRGKFERFLHGRPTTDERDRWNDCYSRVTRELVRFALDLLTGELEEFYGDVDDLRETAAAFYHLDLDRDILEELLNNPPTPVQDTTRGVPGYVSGDDRPTKTEVVEVARVLDEGYNVRTTYETVLCRLRKDGLAAVACMEEGVDYRYYPVRLPDPPNAEHVRTNGEVYEPETTGNKPRWDNFNPVDESI